MVLNKEQATKNWISAITRHALRLVDHSHFTEPSFWATTALALLTGLCLLSLALAFPDTETWPRTLPHLPLALSNSLWLVVSVTLTSGLLGTGLAALAELSNFPGRQFFSTAMLLPLAVPAYVQATALRYFWASSGPVQRLWQTAFGTDIPWFKIPALSGAVFCLSLSLFPYVYLAARHGFQTQSWRAIEAARSLGAGPLRAFFRVGLPVALPWISTGMAWVALQTLSDLGTVSLFHYPTLTTVLYQAWPSSFAEAELFATVLLMLAGGILLLKQYPSRRLRLYPPVNSMPTAPARLPAAEGMFASICAGLTLGLALILPLGLLLLGSVEGLAKSDNQAIAETLLESVMLALSGACLITAFALAVGLSKHQHTGTGLRWLAGTATLGKFVPGIVWATAILALLSLLSKILGECCHISLDLADPSMLGAGISVLLLAFMIRFVGLACVMTERAMSRISLAMDETARGLGVYGSALYQHVYFPLLWRDFLGAFLLSFAALSQELPMTLLLSPEGFKTLPVWVFTEASQDQWEKAALPALVLVLLGLALAYGLIRNGSFRRV